MKHPPFDHLIEWVEIGCLLVKAWKLLVCVQRTMWGPLVLNIQRMAIFVGGRMLVKVPDLCFRLAQFVMVKYIQLLSSQNPFNILWCSTRVVIAVIMSKFWVDVLCICWSQDGKMAADWAMMCGYYEISEILWVKLVYNIIANSWQFHSQHIRDTIGHWGGPQANHVSSGTSHCRTHSETYIFCKSALYWCVIHWHIGDIVWSQSCKVEWAPTKLCQITE